MFATIEPSVPLRIRFSPVEKSRNSIRAPRLPVPTMAPLLRKVKGRVVMGSVGIGKSLPPRDTPTASSAENIDRSGADHHAVVVPGEVGIVADLDPDSIDAVDVHGAARVSG